MPILQTKSLFISAGHSHSDPGATGNGYTEADIVLEFRDLVAKELEGLSFNRDGAEGENLPLHDAVRLAKAHDAAVEFHCNAFSSPSATGVETLSAPKDNELGEELCAAISDVLGIDNRGDKGEGSGQHSRLAFVSGGGGIIVELFFISNPSDLEAYQARKRTLATKVAGVLIDHVAPVGGYS